VVEAQKKEESKKPRAAVKAVEEKKKEEKDKKKEERRVCVWCARVVRESVCAVETAGSPVLSSTHASLMSVPRLPACLLCPGAPCVLCPLQPDVKTVEVKKVGWERELR
jgi:hypothetical protein